MFFGGFRLLQLDSTHSLYLLVLQLILKDLQPGGMLWEVVSCLVPERHIPHILSVLFQCSSTREPAQVFNLLETVYGAFDEIARRRGIFKVETVGDCYVAVCGLPDPRKDHAVAMIRFARDCLARMSSLSQQLEITLGPGKLYFLLQV